MQMYWPQVPGGAMQWLAAWARLLQGSPTEQGFSHEAASALLLLVLDWMLLVLDWMLLVLDWMQLFWSGPSCQPEAASHKHRCSPHVPGTCTHKLLGWDAPEQGSPFRQGLAQVGVLSRWQFCEPAGVAQLSARQTHTYWPQVPGGWMHRLPGPSEVEQGSPWLQGLAQSASCWLMQLLPSLEVLQPGPVQ